MALGVATQSTMHACVQTYMPCQASYSHRTVFCAKGIAALSGTLCLYMPVSIYGTS